MEEDLRRLRSGSDVRGNARTYGDHPVTLTAERTTRIAYTFALWLAEKKGVTSDLLNIAVGRDSRISGPELAASVVRGLTAADCDVLDCGMATTPAMFMTTVHGDTMCDGAVMVTASHHPWYRNGLKFMTAEGGLDGTEIDEILTRAQTVKVPRRLVTNIPFMEKYIEGLKRMIRTRLEADEDELPLLGLSVVVDAGNGAGGFYAQMLSDLGADVEGSQFLEPDGMFPNHAPNPEDEEAMASVSRAVLQAEADLGVIFDCDCDRAALVDERGREINRNRLIALVAAILLEEHPGATFVTDSVTSAGLARFIEEQGGVHYRYKRGYRNVIDEAIRLNEEGIDCPLAIETSGHAALRENYFLDDGMYLVTRLIIEAVWYKRRGKTLGSVIEDLSEPVESRELRLSITAEDFKAAGQKAIEAVLERASEYESWHIAPNNREGVRMLVRAEDGMDTGWFLLRLSVHDPVMPLNLESDVPGGIQKMLSSLYNVLKHLDGLDLSPLAQAIDNDAN